MLYILVTCMVYALAKIEK